MSGPNKIIINASPEDFDEAVRIVREETPHFDRYDKVGWGWGMQRRGYPGVTFWVCRIKDGLSITAKRATPTPTEKA